MAKFSQIFLRFFSELFPGFSQSFLVNTYMNRDTRLMFESYQANTISTYDQLAQAKSNLHVAVGALKACLSHFAAEPTDPGHPALIKTVSRALEFIESPEK